MKSKSKKIEAEVTFLHDLATPLTIASLMLKKLIADISEGGHQNTFEKKVEALNKVFAAIKKIEELHCNRKAEISLKDVA